MILLHDSIEYMIVGTIEQNSRLGGEQQWQLFCAAARFTNGLRLFVGFDSQAYRDSVFWIEI